MSATNEFLRRQIFTHEGREYSAERKVRTTGSGVGFVWILRTADGNRVGEIESSASWTVGRRDAIEFLTAKEN